MPSHYARVPPYRVVHNVQNSMRHYTESMGSGMEVAKLNEASQKAFGFDVLQFCSLACCSRSDGDQLRSEPDLVASR